ncbi:protein of unknown function (plasmid) [Streptantibioticus cattleyicolor NRRL 8057 = DSM 46488]|nr:protein of unknown function [Streptantibioticus cattleyicolor NRRL 8057 = DSM 46488]
MSWPCRPQADDCLRILAPTRCRCAGPGGGRVAARGRRRRAALPRVVEARRRTVPGARRRRRAHRPFTVVTRGSPCPCPCPCRAVEAVGCARNGHGSALRSFAFQSPGSAPPGNNDTAPAEMDTEVLSKGFP